MQLNKFNKAATVWYNPFVALTLEGIEENRHIRNAGFNLDSLENDSTRLAGTKTN